MRAGFMVNRMTAMVLRAVARAEVGWHVAGELQLRGPPDTAFPRPRPGVRGQSASGAFRAVAESPRSSMTAVTDSGWRDPYFAPRTLLRAKPSKGGDAEPRGYGGFTPLRSPGRQRSRHGSTLAARSLFPSAGACHELHAQVGEPVGAPETLDGLGGRADGRLRVRMRKAGCDRPRIHHHPARCLP